MKDLLGFDRLITPSILVFFYWISSALIIISGVLMLFSGHAGQGIAVLVLGLISCRISFELIMIAFKNNEYLKKIAEQTQR
ncbi:DUF4282 domain-containing protein [Neisseriaceae bacterium CLB008]|nr:DUF4282 domain-containing protein [Neisseriaceae bacterium]